MKRKTPENDRRSKNRFAIQRELHFKLLNAHTVIETGPGKTIDISSDGVAFEAVGKFRPGAMVQLSISWPVLLDQTCLMQLMILGRVVRAGRKHIACTIDRYEFRTQARVAPNPERADPAIRRWVESTEKECKAAAVEAIAAYGF